MNRNNLFSKQHSVLCKFLLQGIRHNNISRSNTEACSLNLILPLRTDNIKRQWLSEKQEKCRYMFRNTYIIWQWAEKISSSLLSKVALYTEFLGFKVYSCPCTLPAFQISAANINQSWERQGLRYKIISHEFIISNTAHYQCKFS